MEWDRVLCELIKLRENESWFAIRCREFEVEEGRGYGGVHPATFHGRRAAALQQAVEAVRYRLENQRRVEELFGSVMHDFWMTPL